MTAKLRHHHFTWDPDIPQDAKDRRFCVCELREDHPIHDLPPAPPQQAAHRQRYGGE
jgi:hypothetical protein